jgi:hypothetical protein
LLSRGIEKGIKAIPFGSLVMSNDQAEPENQAKQKKPSHVKNQSKTKPKPSEKNKD